MTSILKVELGDRSYPIYIGANLLGESAIYGRHIVGSQVMVITNDTVAPLYLDTVVSALAAFNVQSLILPDGEQYKNIETLNLVFDSLLEHRFSRQCTLVALGGGVIGDMAGFAAACYQRGVPFIQVPTTLLAQVDSSVGGKTGVNHPRGKNMIGAFHQPRGVIADTRSLDTLPDRELCAGIAEIIKYGLIRDPDFFLWLEQHMPDLLRRDPEALAYAIERSCCNKAKVVAADELEAGQRALLNLGHTFGHAIETGMGYGSWLHGEAVAAGICMAADLSVRLGWLAQKAAHRIRSLIAQARLPVAAPQAITPDQFRRHMAVDKKVLDGKLRLVLLRDIGEAVVTDAYDPKLLDATLRRAGVGPA